MVSKFGFYNHLFDLKLLKLYVSGPTIKVLFEPIYVKEETVINSVKFINVWHILYWITSRRASAGQRTLDYSYLS